MKWYRDNRIIGGILITVVVAMILFFIWEIKKFSIGGDEVKEKSKVEKQRN